MNPHAATIVALALTLLLGGACARHSPRPATENAPPPATTQQPRPIHEVAALPPQSAAGAISRRIRALVVQGHAAIDPTGLGYYLDVLQARLTQIGSQQLQIVREGEIIRLRLPASAGFEVGHATLMPAGALLVDQLAIVLDEFDAILIAVHGHTDDTGNPENNQRLSGQRARAVTTRLERAGVRPARLIAIGHGQSQPLVANDTDAGRERNRRVELELIPILR